MYFLLRLVALEEKIRDPGSIASIDSLLDTVTALISDCTHDPVKQLKNIEAYTSRCKKITKYVIYILIPFINSFIFQTRY